MSGTVASKSSPEMAGTGAFFTGSIFMAIVPPVAMKDTVGLFWAKAGLCAMAVIIVSVKAACLSFIWGSPVRLFRGFLRSICQSSVASATFFTGPWGHPRFRAGVWSHAGIVQVLGVTVVVCPLSSPT